VTQIFPFAFHTTVQPSTFYVFLDAGKVGDGSMVLKARTTTLTMVALLANDGYGEIYSYDASGATLPHSQNQMEERISEDWSRML
jgi:hypothetical protein